MQPNCEFLNCYVTNKLFSIMKKSLFIIAFLCVSVTMFAEEKTQENKQDSVKGVHPYKLEENEKGIKPEIAHWSIIPHIGFSAFDGDFTSEMSTV